MNLYQLIVPSESITFYAEEDKVAYACAVIIGSGKAGCKRMQGKLEYVLYTALASYNNPNEIMLQNLETELEDFVEQHKEEISKALQSFAHVSPDQRKEYDDACSQIKDPAALVDYMLDHENRNRKTQAKLVQYAWKLSEIIHRLPEEIAA